MNQYYLLSIINLSYINYVLYCDNLREHVETFAKKQTSSLFSMFSIYIKTLAKKPPSSDYKITSHYIEYSFIRSPIDLGKPELVSKIVTKSFRDTMYLDEKTLKQCYAMEIIKTRKKTNHKCLMLTRERINCRQIVLCALTSVDSLEALNNFKDEYIQFECDDIRFYSGFSCATKLIDPYAIAENI